MTKVSKNEIKKRYKEKHFGTIRYHVQEKIASWRNNSLIPSNLTVDYLINLYQQQDGCCYFSGEKLIFPNGPSQYNSLSLTKLNPDRGYVQDNVVWTTHLVKNMKMDLTESQFYDKINRIIKLTYGVSMNKEFTTKEKLLKITMESKLGDLPKIIEQVCTEEAKKGKYACRIYFAEPPEGMRGFYSSLGPANRELWKEVDVAFNKRIELTQEDFNKQVVKDLADETNLEIILVPQPRPDPGGSGKTLHAENFGAYRYASVVLDVSWK